MFPDAPTERGRRHLETLARAAAAGIRAGVAIVIQRGDVDRFQPNATLDPEFAGAFNAAIRAGVRIRAFTTHVRPDGVDWGHNVPVSSGSLYQRLL
jgi:sugar fermentation stimulation protein A